MEKIVFALLFSLVGLVLLKVGASKSSILNKQKKECTASAEGVFVDVAHKGKDYKIVEFKYTAEGIEYVQKAPVGFSLYNSMSKGKNIAVLYNPSEPSQFYIPENSKPATMVALLYTLGAFSLLMAVAFLFLTAQK
ncbi:MAG: DUF3592 domain-containing protein [Synergistaceae bacterium]|nr:DUF3592 domain-containing protein [Synergistaceae bacterium]